jgi:hypothetical protein
MNTAAIFKHMDKEAAAAVEAADRTALKRKRIGDLVDGMHATPDLLSSLHKVHQTAYAPPKDQADRTQRFIKQFSEYMDLTCECQADAKRAKKQQRAASKRDKNINAAKLKNCTHGGRPHGPVTTTAHHTIGGDLAFVQPVCDTCGTSALVTVMAKGVDCSACDECVGAGCTTAEEYRAEIEKHTLDAHGSTATPCTYLCGTVFVDHDPNVWEHRASCIYSPRNAPTTQSTATRTGSGGQNVNLTWVEVPTCPGADAKCTDCDRASAHFTAIMVGGTISLRCQDCVTIAGPNSPVHMTSDLWSNMARAPERTPNAQRNLFI